MNNKNPKKWSGLKYPDSDLISLIMKHVDPIDRDGIAIDIGCGAGRHVKLLNDIGFDAFGIDSDSSMINICKNNGINAFVSDITKFKYDKPIKLVIGWGLNMLVENVNEIIANNLSPEYLIMDWRSPDDNSCYNFNDNIFITEKKVIIKKENHTLNNLEYIFHRKEDCIVPGYELVYMQKISKKNDLETNSWYQTVHKKI